MSRIGKLPINIPAGVTVTVSADNVVSVKGPKGEMTQAVDPSIKVNVADSHITFEIDEQNDAVELKQKQAFHGLYRALVNNMVVGVSEGYVKKLELVGVGYRASNQGNIIEFSLGYTHNIFIQLPKEIKVETKSERNQNPLIILESCDKQLLGQVCAKIRSFRKPEPYKGKGVLFVGEQSYGIFHVFCQSKMKWCYVDRDGNLSIIRIDCRIVLLVFFNGRNCGLASAQTNQV